jgi:hypothetical protein
MVYSVKKDQGVQHSRAFAVGNPGAAVVVNEGRV